MNILLTSRQMRELEHAAMASGDVTGLQLMERAGQGCVDALMKQWPELAEDNHHAVVICGPGNNGGDGFVIARLLHDLGWTVEVLFGADPASLPPDARTAYQAWSGVGECQPMTRDVAMNGAHPDVLIDAYLGIGATRPLDAQTAMLFWDIQNRPVSTQAPCRTVAVDCASGFSCDTGAFLVPPCPEDQNSTHWHQTKVRPWRWLVDLTVTFHLPKVGHVLGALPGALVVADIGLNQTAESDPGQALPVIRSLNTPAENWPGCHVHKHAETLGHKYSYGHALVCCGGAGRTGAARLAARAALRIGAGLVTLGVPGSALLEVSGHLTSIMTTRVDTPALLGATLSDRRLTAVCLGPGLGFERARWQVPEALGARCATVLDADALSAYSDAPEDLFAMTHDACVLTPHGGEFARLFPDLAEALTQAERGAGGASKCDVTRAAAQRAGCVVVFKGAMTVIGAPDRRCSIHAATADRAAPWLATAGSGDVLAGLITGLLARGVAPFEAAEVAVWLHTQAARAFGPGLIAEDLPDILPSVLAEL